MVPGLALGGDQVETRAHEAVLTGASWARKNSFPEKRRSGRGWTGPLNFTWRKDGLFAPDRWKAR